MYNTLSAYGLMQAYIIPQACSIKQHDWLSKGVGMFCFGQTHQMIVCTRWIWYCHPWSEKEGSGELPARLR